MLVVVRGAVERANLLVITIVVAGAKPGAKELVMRGAKDARGAVALVKGVLLRVVRIAVLVLARAVALVLVRAMAGAAVVRGAVQGAAQVVIIRVNQGAAAIVMGIVKASASALASLPAIPIAPTPPEWLQMNSVNISPVF